MQLAYERKFFSLKPASTYLCGTREGRHGTENVRDKYLNSAIEALRKKTYHTLSVSFSGRASKACPWKCVPQGTRRWSRERQNAGVKKSARQPRAFTLVFNGCDWTVGFRGGLKWKSRRNGKTHQNEIQDSGRFVAARRIPWKNTDIFYITFCSYANAFFPSPVFSHLRTRVLSSTISGRPPSRHPRSPSRLAQLEKATLHSRGTSKQNS